MSILVLGGAGYIGSHMVDRLIEKGKDGKNKTVYYKDEATRDSIAANKYNDQEVQTMKPGSYKKGKWTPDRSKFPYKKK